MKYYTGIGSRNTPEDIGSLMEDIAKMLDQKGYTLRSGGANGADTFFEQGAKHKDIFLPWKGFNGNQSQLYANSDNQATLLAEKHHPVWDKLPRPVRKLMERNVYQILGRDLKTPTSFVVCWTPDGCQSGKTRTWKTGGTGLAISLASSMDIPVFNLQRPEALGLLNTHLDYLDMEALRS